jgi:hypothetical protein
MACVSACPPTKKKLAKHSQFEARATTTSNDTAFPVDSRVYNTNILVGDAKPTPHTHSPV